MVHINVLVIKKIPNMDLQSHYVCLYLQSEGENKVITQIFQVSVFFRQ